jgi:hypothetical protein
VATTKEEHLVKAQEILALRNSLDLTKAGAIGWSITMLFYAGLHYVEAYLVATKGMGCKHHFSRATEIQNDPRIRPLYKEYSMLETLSREARYDVSSFNVGDLRYAENCFENIREAIEAII